jgi:hypothetical protein
MLERVHRVCIAKRFTDWQITGSRREPNAVVAPVPTTMPLSLALFDTQ